MSVERRSILKGAAASIAYPTSLATLAAASSDPLVALIREYQSGTAEFNARSATEKWGDLTEATYGPSMDRLCFAPPMPTSLAGAMEGIEFVLSEMAPARLRRQRGRSEGLRGFPPSARWTERMSPIRINRKRGKSKPTRSYGVKPVSLPTFSFYGHLPVVYVDGELIVGRRVNPLEPRR